MPTNLAVERFPAPEFRTPYTLPPWQAPGVHWFGWEAVDVGLLALALGIAAWLVFWRRSRPGIFLLTAACVAYFGFFRKGCVCPIGSIQNVALAAGGHGYALPWGVAFFFAAPLLAALFYGRVFCSGVCPLGAIQDLVLWRAVQVPAWLEHFLGLFPYAYLGLAALFATVGSDFVICRYDPFVGFFRLSGPAHMLVLGAMLLGLGMFVGRPYCRFICPYSVPLRVLSIFSKRQVSITPDKCIDCRLCETSCPFGALRLPTPAEPRRKIGEGRRAMAAAVVALPVLVALFAWIGYLSGPAMSRVDFTVRLAERVRAEDEGTASGTTEESDHFRATGQPVETLYASAADVQKTLSRGTAIFGAWMGLVVGLKLVRLTSRRQLSGYTADPGGCLACARCFETCPVQAGTPQLAEVVR